MRISYDPVDQNAAYLFKRGENVRSYELFGPHRKGKDMTFTLFAPRAHRVELASAYDDWQGIEMRRDETTGLFTVTVDMPLYTPYKYKIYGEDGLHWKADPFAFSSESIPGTASIALPLEDIPVGEILASPLQAIYEVHLGSWMRDGDRFLNYRELAHKLIDYVKDLHFSHVELLPIMEHPYDGSWGYQITGFFSVTGRYGTAEDFAYFVDYAHKNGIGVILDWTPAHFCKDEQGLRYLDGTPTYESDEAYYAENRIWDTMAFDYTKGHVQSFLFSSANFFCRYGIDGIRVDAVSYMLYKGFGERDTDTKNPDNHRSDTIYFLKELLARLHAEHPGLLMIAEESEDYRGLTKPLSEGGLGFDRKWNMGWMHDILDYMEMDPIYRQYHHDALTFPIMYSFNEKYILPFSHDEVVHGKKSLLDKMYGGYEEKFQQLRLLYLYMMAHPGEKLLFMGQEFGQFREWVDNEPLDWFLLDYDSHRSLRDYFKALMAVYRTNEALSNPREGFDGFRWDLVNAADISTIAFSRIGENQEIMAVMNFTPVGRNVRIAAKGDWRILFSTHMKEGAISNKDGYIDIQTDGYEGIYLLKEV